MSSTSSADRFVRPTGGDLAFNRVVAWLTRHGVSLMGSRVLTVAGRRTGTPHSTPVNLLTLDGDRYLVAPRGTTAWVRNIRVSGTAQLSVGRRTEQVAVTELPVAERVPVIRQYLVTWGWEVGRFVEGLTKHSTDEQIAAVAAGFPVFRLGPSSAPTA